MTRMDLAFAVVLVSSGLIHTMAHERPSLVECPSTCRCDFTDEKVLAAECSGHGLTSIPCGLPSSLQRLVLSNNNISQLQCDDFDNMSQLLYLDLSSNKIQYLGCHGMKSEFVNCPDNGNLKNNGSLNARRHILGKTPLSQLTKLRDLILRSNVISRLNAFQFLGSFNLQLLDLSLNPLSKIDPNSFKGLSSLHKLNLDVQQIPHLPDTLFEDLTNLTDLTLNFSKNHASENCYSDKALSRLTSLKSFQVNGLPSPCVPGPGFKNLTQLSRLDFTNGGCFIGSLPEFFFSNVTTQANLTIVMNSCLLTFVHPDTFASVPTMVSLDLSFNEDLRCKNVYLASSSFPNTTIKELNMSGINRIPFLRLTSTTFEYIGITSLEVLKLSNNYIVTIDVGVVRSLPKTLKLLDLSDNEILRPKFLYAIPILTNLEILILSKQNQFSVSGTSNKDVKTTEDDICHILRNDNLNPKEISKQSLSYQKFQSMDNHIPRCETDNKKKNLVICGIQKSRKNGGYITYGDWSHIVKKTCPSNNPYVSKSKLNDTAVKITEPVLDRLLDSLSDEIFSFHFEFINGSGSKSDPLAVTLPKNLRQLYMSQLKLGYSIPPLRITINQVLWYWNASHNFLWCFEGPVWGVSALKILDLTGNFALAVSSYFFKGWTNILQLRLSDNMLAASFELDEDGVILSWLEKLEILEIKRNGLRRLHLKAFAHNGMLQTIDLADNNLHDLPLIFHLRNLTSLDISSNLLESLSDHVMAGLDHVMLSSNVTVDLSNNPLSCDCFSLPFLMWYRRTNVTFVEADKYTCTFINGTKFNLKEIDTFVPKLWRICAGKSFFIASLTLLFVTILSGIFLALINYYTYRLLFYVYFSRQQFLTRLYELERSGLRDVFLVYDDQDRSCRHHVANVLLPNLTAYGLTYHVSEIGLYSPSAGRGVRDVVEEAVLGGRKTLVLLTEEIFQDEDKQLEVGMARITEEMLGFRRLIILSAQKNYPKSLPVYIYHLLRTSRTISYSPTSEQFWSLLAREIKN